MTRLGFMSAGEAARVSPLAGLDLGGVISDVPGLAKVELRGDPDGVELCPGEALIRIGPQRSLIVGEFSAAETVKRLQGRRRVYDMSAALAVLEFEGEPLFRRLCELDPDRLPASGAILRGTPALIERRDGERFRLFVACELGRFVAETIVDLAGGIET